MNINANYVFLIPQSNGEYDLGYYGSSEQWINLGIFNVTSTALKQAAGVINSFNQHYVGTTVNNQQFIPLAYIIVIGNSSGAIQLPVQDHAILLSKVNPGYWTIIVTSQNYSAKLIFALDAGYKESKQVVIGSPIWYPPVWYQQPIGTILQETMAMQAYREGSFTGGYVIEMSNGTLVPWGFLFHASHNAFGGNLLFILQASPIYHGLSA